MYDLSFSATAEWVVALLLVVTMAGVVVFA